MKHEVEHGNQTANLGADQDHAPTVGGYADTTLSLFIYNR